MRTIISTLALVFALNAFAIFCPKCGTESPDDSSFCSKCGQKLPKLKTDSKESTAVDNTRSKETESSLADVNMKDLAGALVIIKTNIGSGSGFIANFDGDKYIVTNQHVLEEANIKQIKIETLNGEELRPTGCEIVESLDLMRIPFKSKNPEKISCLELSSEEPKVGSPVVLLGNSGGASVCTRLEGKILGFGADNIETDAKAISGNSGCPVINGVKKVIGVHTAASRVPKRWDNVDSRFINARRIALRIPTEENAWKKINIKDYLKQSYILNDVNCMLDDIWTISSSEDHSKIYNEIQDVAQQKYNDKKFHLVTLRTAKKISTLAKSLEASNSKKHALKTMSNIYKLLFSCLKSAQDVLKYTQWQSEFLRKKAELILSDSDQLKVVLKKEEVQNKNNISEIFNTEIAKLQQEIARVENQIQIYKKSTFTSDKVIVKALYQKLRGLKSDLEILTGEKQDFGSGSLGGISRRL